MSWWLCAKSESINRAYTSQLARKQVSVVFVIDALAEQSVALSSFPPFELNLEKKRKAKKKKKKAGAMA